MPTCGIAVHCGTINSFLRNQNIDFKKAERLYLQIFIINNKPLFGYLRVTDRTQISFTGKKFMSGYSIQFH